MRRPRLLYSLTGYYLSVTVVLLAAVWIFPQVTDYLPIGGVEDLVVGAGTDPFGASPIGATQAARFSGSLAWLIIAIGGALLASLPVSWTYIAVRARAEYDQSLVQTILLLPMIVTGIVVVVRNSLALAFAIAGIAAGVQFRHSLKSAGDALFILLAIAIGLAAGIGAVELAIVVSIAFNYCFVALWVSDYGARSGGRRYLRKLDAQRAAKARDEKKEGETP